MSIKQKIKSIVNRADNELYYPQDIRYVQLETNDRQILIVPVVFNEDKTRFKDLLSGYKFNAYDAKKDIDKIGTQICKYYELNYYKPSQAPVEQLYVSNAKFLQYDIQSIYTNYWMNNNLFTGGLNLKLARDSLVLTERLEDRINKKFDCYGMTEYNSKSRAEIVDYCNLASKILTKYNNKIVKREENKEAVKQKRAQKEKEERSLAELSRKF